MTPAAANPAPSSPHSPRGPTVTDPQPAGFDKNRFLTTLALTMLLWGAWFGFIQPRFFPQAAPNAQKVRPDLADRGDDPLGEFDPDAEPAAEVDPDDPDAPSFAENPPASVTLGGTNAEAIAAGYAAGVTLSSRGAGVTRVTLNDPRYKELDDRGKPLAVLGNGAAFVDTLDTRVDALDAALRPFGTDSVTAHWELEKTFPDDADPAVAAGAVWRLEAPDGSFAATKTYRLRKRPAAPDLDPDDDPRGYLLDLDLTLENRSDAARTAKYTVQGPVGLPLENVDNTRKFRDIELGFLEGPGDLAPTYMTATDATEAVRASRRSLDADRDVRRLEGELMALQARFDAAEEDAGADPGDPDLAAAVAELDDKIGRLQRDLNRRVDDATGGGTKLEEWRQPFRYVGAEVQYFAALLFPRDGAAELDPRAGRFAGLGEDFAEPVIASVVPQVLDEPDRADAQKNDISVRLTGRPVELGPGASATRSFTLFAGPKKLGMLETLGAGDVVDLGWFGVIGGWMLAFMGFLHDHGFPYWLAIISLTVCVRMLMFPMSKRAAVMASKQKALAPKLAEIKKKHGEDLQASGREQMALMRRHGVNPLLGCLPVFFTIPVFVALYNALLNSVDLRLAEFLWIDNLAAPDNVFRLPFTLPYLGQFLNVLPVLLAGLWFFQQKLFMPPAQSPEQELQYKLMGYMMPLSALFIYHLPAGWCLYSIASACWTLTERKLLDRTRNAQIDFDAVPEPREPGPIGRAVKKVTEKPMANVRAKLAEAAAAAEAAQKDAQMRQVVNKREPAGVGGGSSKPRKGGGNRRKKKR